MKKPMDLQVVSLIDVIDEEVSNYVNMSLVNNPLVGVLWNGESNTVEVFIELVAYLMGLRSCTKNLMKFDLDLKTNESPPARPSIFDPP